MKTLKRYLLMAFAGFCVVMGVIGIVVPGMPTTVFILMAGWAAARSSPTFLAWLENHRLFGPMLRDWRASGSVSRKAKWCATGSMTFCAVVLFIVSPVPWLAPAVTLLMATILCWLWRRPEPVPQSGLTDEPGSLRATR